MGDRVGICVVGAGYGGSIMALRLAQRLTELGKLGPFPIVVLEKGYDFHGSFDGRSTLKNPWSEAERKEGYVTKFQQKQDPEYQSKLYSFYLDQSADAFAKGRPSYRIATGKGLGGGSLINGAASLRAPTTSFEQLDEREKSPRFGRRRWPKVYTRKSLDPYYKRVEDFLGVQTLRWTTEPGKPDWAVVTRRDYAFAVGCLKCGYSAQPIRAALDNCRNCGFCYTGCPFDAKNAIRYPLEASKLGVRFETECEVTGVSPAPGGKRGYEVRYVDARSRDLLGNPIPRSLECQILILSAGTVGTSVILLKSLKNFSGARALSEQVGRNVSADGDLFLGGLVGEEFVRENSELNNFQGKAVNAATFHFWKQWEQTGDKSLRFIIESFSLLPWLTVWGLPAQMAEADKPEAAGRNSVNAKTPLYGKTYKKILDKHGSHVMSMLVLGLDQAEGEIHLRDLKDIVPADRRRLLPSFRVPSVEWPETHGLTDKMWANAVGAARNIYRALGGDLLCDTYRDDGIVTGPHSIGGSIMVNEKEGKGAGVAKPNGEVFGNDNLFIADGSLMPPIGVNPYLSIAAVAERNAELLQKELMKRLV